MDDLDYVREHLIGAISATGDAVTAQGKLQDSLAAEIQRLWADNAALRDELHAVANRLESLTAFVTSNPAEVAEAMTAETAHRRWESLGADRG